MTTPASHSSPRLLRRSGPFTRALGCSEASPAYSAPPTVRVDEPGDLIAAIPALLGFTPERSLVLAMLCPGGHRGAEVIEAVMRFDLDSLVEPGALEQFTDCVVSICVREQAVGVLAVQVDDRAGPSLAITRLRVALLDALAGQGVPIRGAWTVGSISAGARYRDLFDPGAGGVVPDPSSSLVAVSQVLDGRPIRQSRADLIALLAPDELRRAGVQRLLCGAARSYHRDVAAARRIGRDAEQQRQMLEWILWQIADVESGEPRTNADLARIAVLVRDQPIRDVMYGIALGEHAEAAELLWTQLARATVDRDRAEAASLLGYSAYVRGDGPFAGIALGLAVEADGDHTMSVLLETSLQAGLRPDRLHKLGECGHQLATDLGIDLGPITR
ncbi:DUF4192 domain-containing protein [Nocardia camponoti]|nr:DUF4192 domain-containing protein [Nocardia camponoti]